LEHRALHLAHDLVERLLCFAEEGVQKRRVAHVVALFAVLEVNVRMLELTGGSRTVPVISEEGKPVQIGWMGRGCAV
jgi:hypothetical protein